jgi:hypothetical protein
MIYDAAMSNIASQVHNRFKVFSGELEPGHRIDALAKKVTDFVASGQGKIAPKSIGVEYLESAHRLIVTLGYRDDEPGYPVALHAVSLGRVAHLDGDDFTALEAKMAEAGGKLERVICHELFITEDHEFLMVFMTHG